jgi:hypothetical protein
MNQIFNTINILNKLYQSEVTVSSEKCDLPLPRLCLTQTIVGRKLSAYDISCWESILNQINKLPYDHYYISADILSTRQMIPSGTNRPPKTILDMRVKFDYHCL